MNIQTIVISKFLHVDSSLVSKWKTGNRNLSPKSIYFNEIIELLLQLNEEPNHHFLEESLLNFYPHEEINQHTDLEPLLRSAISNQKTTNTLKNQGVFHNDLNSTTTLVYESNSGKREAIRKMLDYAESMNTPGNFLFIDAEEFAWLLEDEAFTDEFCSRIVLLLKQGFKAKFIIHYSSYSEHFMNFFHACSSLIFYKNIEWFYYHYYNETIFNISFFILNRAVSLLSLSSNGAHSTTTIYTDPNLVLQHEALADHTLKHCNLFFNNFDIQQFTDVVNGISQFQKRGAFYSILSAPAFITVHPTLLLEVLQDNQVEKEYIDICIDTNRKLKSLTSHYFTSGKQQRDPFIYVFNLDKLIKRATTPPFVSTTLSLLCGKKIIVRPEQYARALKSLANALNKYNNFQIVLVSEKDPIPMPAINSWCKQNTWMLNMNNGGFRLSEELSIIDATATTINRCIQSLPPIRREKESVRRYLLELADNIVLDI